MTHYRCIQYWVRTYDDPKTYLGGIEDAPADRPFAQTVNVNSWNATSGWNSTTDDTARANVEDVIGMPGNSRGKSSVFVTSL
jgi:hypothetical protein